MRGHLHSGEIPLTVMLYNPSGRAALQRVLLGRVAVSFVLSGEGEADALARVRGGMAHLIEMPLATAKISSLAGEDRLDALGQWIGGRLTRCYGQWLRVDRVELSYLGEPAQVVGPIAREPQAARGRLAADDRARAPGRTSSAHADAHASADASGSVNANANADAGGGGAAGRFLARLLEAELTAPYGGGQRFTRRHDVAVARQLLQEATATTTATEARPVRFCTLVCPPYLKQHDDGAHGGYVGLASDFTVTPPGYHRSYDYIQYFRSLRAIAAAARGHGLAIAPTIVFADRGLVGIDGLRTTLPSERDLLDRLASFRESMRRYAAEHFPEIAIVSFQEIATGPLAPLMPLGLPIGDAARIAWLRHACADSALEHDYASLIETCLGVVERVERGERTERVDQADGVDGIDEVDAVDGAHTLRDIEHWRHYASFVAQCGSDVERGRLYDILKMYSNIVWIRRREAMAAEQSGGAPVDAGELRRAALIDALVRWVQYGLYARAIADRCAPAVMVYQDDGFTACGNALRLPGVPVLFIDPALVDTWAR